MSTTGTLTSTTLPVLTTEIWNTTGSPTWAVPAGLVRVFSRVYPALLITATTAWVACVSSQFPPTSSAVAATELVVSPGSVCRTAVKRVVIVNILPAGAKALVHFSRPGANTSSG